MRVRSSSVLYICALALTILMPAVLAHASFSNASLKGSYSVLLNRWTANSSENESALLGVMKFDGAGNVTLSFTLMSGSVFQTGNASGTYTVSANGTGTIAFTSGFPLENDFNILVNSSASGLAKGIALLRTDTNYPADCIGAGNAVLQSTTAVTYSLASLKGNYSVLLNKWTPELAAQQEGTVAQIVFNGTGGFKGVFSQRNNGVTTTNNITGTYTVNSDGSGTLTVTGSGHPLDFVLNTITPTTPAKGAHLLQSVEDNGTNQVHTGVALKQ